METNKLIRKIHMACPLCDKTHEVEERTRTAMLTIKDDAVEYEETYYFCTNSDEDENEFATGRMSNTNLLNARNAYRKKHNLLTSNEIIEIRERYGLSQIDLARLLGWGEATISRYESKAIQDEAYDNMLRIIKDNPLKTLEFLDKNSDKFSNAKRLEIQNKIVEKLDTYGREYLTRQALESEYVLYREPSDSNGWQTLDIDKVECMVSYLATYIPYLYKVKLMKTLWYTDALCYQSTGKAMSGLVYRHDKMGALPIGHSNIINLENITFQEEDGYDSTKYHFYPNDGVNMSCLTSAEISILNKVIEKFKNFNAAEIVNYMHEETAYKRTYPGDIIPFSLAGEIHAF